MALFVAQERGRNRDHRAFPTQPERDSPMPTPPWLLNDDKTASMATLLMLSHHGFRRDLGRFRDALEALAPGGGRSIEDLRQEWASFVEKLHGHHQAEDTGIFPGLAQQGGALAAVIEQLSADHRRIDPLLERGTAAFARLPEAGDALAVVGELDGLLRPHLATEERELIPSLRDAKSFPPPPDENMLELYAQGFAWAMHGIAQEVLDQVYLMLPPELVARLPAARATFDARCTRVWGPLEPGAARTPIPEGHGA